MATRMQQRRGTAAQWISTNSGNGPILAAGEIGYESDTNKFKIGDGTNHWLSLDYFMDADSTTNPQFGSALFLKVPQQMVLKLPYQLQTLQQIERLSFQMQQEQLF